MLKIRSGESLLNPVDILGGGTNKKHVKLTHDMQRDYWNRRFASGDKAVDSAQNVTNSTYQNQMLLQEKVKIIRQLQSGYSLKSGVVDAGCGPGLVLQNMDADSIGYDFSEVAVGVCQKAGLRAELIESLTDIPKTEAGLVCCLDVMIHVTEDERWADSVNHLLSVADSLLILDGVLSSDLKPDEKAHVRIRTLEDYAKLTRRPFLVIPSNVSPGAAYMYFSRAL